MKMCVAQERYIHWVEATKGLSPHTVRAYGGDVSAFANHVGAEARVEDISFDLIVGFLEAQRASGLSPASMRRRLAALRSFCRFLSANGLLLTDIWAGGSLTVKKQKKLPRPVPRTEVDDLLRFLCRSANLDTRLPACGVLPRPNEATTLLAVALMYSTGLRVGELVGIRCMDLDPSGQSICVNGKGSRERRVYFPGGWITELVTAYLATRDHLAIQHARVFFNRRGAPLTAPALRSRLARAAHGAGVERHITPHMLRHSAATQLIESGVDIRYVQRLLGHASLSTTEIYTHVSDDALRQMISKANVLARAFALR
jgi:integrase/recombinase XerD